MMFLRCIGALLSSAVLLTACSGDDPEEPASAGTGASTATATETASPTSTGGAVVWADGVCSATADLRSSVQQIGGTLQIDPGESETARDQVRTQLRERGAEVESALADLRTAVTTLPPEAEPQLEAARDRLAGVSENAGARVESLRTAIDEALTAATPEELRRALTSVVGAFATAAAQVQIVVSTVQQDAAARDPVVHDAFATAPACGELTAGRT